MWKRLLHPTLVMSFAAALMSASIAPTAVFALPSDSVAIATAAGQREAATAAILQALSRPEAQLRLRLAGISPEDLQERLAKLDDTQLASVADRAQMVNAAGDAGVGIAIGVLVILVLVVLLVNLLDDDEVEIDT